MCRHVVAGFHGVDMPAMTLRTQNHGWKGGTVLPLVYACEILAELRQWLPPEETFRIRKAREGC